MDKKKGKLKRGMGILLAVVMLFNTLPISGFAVSALEKQEALDAANAPTPIEEPSEDAVAMVEKEGEAPSYVTSLADAFVTGNSGAKITLLADVDIGKTGLTVPQNTNFTLDCGSFTLSGDGNYTIEVKTGGALAFAGGTVCNTGNGAAAAVWVNGTFTMSGGVLDSTSSYALLVNARYAQVTVTGGTVGINGVGLCVIDNSKATIALSGGTYSSISPGREGTNGNYTYHPVSSVLAPGCALKGADGFIHGDATGNQKKVTVVACTHDGGATPYEDGATHGGICPYCGTVIENAPHTLGADNKCEGCNTPLVASVKIGDDTTYYGTLQAAVDAAADGTVTLLADVEMESCVKINSTCTLTLDLNGHNINCTGNTTGAIYSDKDVSVTIKGDGEVQGVKYAVNIYGGNLILEGGVFRGGVDVQASFRDSTPGILTVAGAGVNVDSLLISPNVTVALSAGTYGKIEVVNGYLKDLLTNYGQQTGTHYAYYRGDAPVTEGLDSMDGDNPWSTIQNVTVRECKHNADGVAQYQHIDGTQTHTLTCLACGYTEAAEDCSYGTEYQHDDTNHWKTCPVCQGTTMPEAHYLRVTADEPVNGVTQNREACDYCDFTKTPFTVTVIVPSSLTYGNTVGIKPSYTISIEKTFNAVQLVLEDGEGEIEYMTGDTLPDNLPAGSYKLYLSGGVLGNPEPVFKGRAYFTVVPAPLTGDMVTLSPESVTYNGTEQKPAITVKQGETTLAEGTDYDVTYSTTDFTNVGTITVTITGKGNYKGTMKKTYSIAKAPLTIKACNQEITYGDNIETNLGGSALGPVVYDNLCTGDKLESINFTPSTENVPGGTIKLSGAVIKNYKGEDVTGNYDTTYEDGTLTINKAEGKLTVPKTSFEKKFRDEDFSLGSTSNVGNISYTSSNVDVALVSADGKVQIKGVGTANITVSLAESKNYTGDEETVTVTVGKADTPTVDNQLKQYICGKGSGGNTVKTDISEKLPSDRGNTVYTFTSDEAGILSDVGIDENGMLTYKVGTGTANTAASVTVAAEMENYKTADFVLTIKLVDKIKVEITAKAEDAVYDGKLHKGYADGITCDYPVEGYEFIYNGRGGTVYGSSEPPKDAGSYTVTISVSDKSGDYEEKSVSLNFTVEKSSISIKADNKSVNKGAPLPKLTYTVSGLAEKDSLASAPEITCNADTKTEGSYTITVGGAKVPDTKNYNGEITYENGTLTVINPAGGSSGGGSADGSGGTGTTLIPSTPAVTTTSDGTVVSLNKDGAYVDKNGKPAADTLIKEPTGEMHVTDSTGHIVKDVIVTTADKTTYVVGAKGNVVVSDIVEIKGNKYVADGKGQLVVSSFSTVGGEKYYSDAKGLVKTAGFFNVSGKKYYADEDGVIAVKKLITVNGRKYFAAKGGAIASKKIVTTGGKKYYAAKSGKIAENKVVKAGGKKYFATGDGSLATGKWIKAGNKKYFCNKKGVITKTKKIKAY